MPPFAAGRTVGNRKSRAPAKKAVGLVVRRVERPIVADRFEGASTCPAALRSENSRGIVGQPLLDPGKLTGKAANSEHLISQERVIRGFPLRAHIFAM